MFRIAVRRRQSFFAANIRAGRSFGSCTKAAAQNSGLRKSV